MASFYEVPVTAGGSVNEWKGRWEEREGLLLRGGELDAGELFQMGSGRGSCLPCGALQGQVDWGQVEGSWWLRSGWSPQDEGGGAGCLWLLHPHFPCVSCCEDRKADGPSAAQTPHLHSSFGQLVSGLLGQRAVGTRLELLCAPQGSPQGHRVSEWT
jgi:hypothetical protein